MDSIAASVPAELVDMERALELDRLDTLQAAVFHEAASGSRWAIKLVLQIQAMRARYFGLPGF